MTGKYLGICVFVLAAALMVASCDLAAPDMVLRVVNPSIAATGVNNIRITFQLYNDGSEKLENCKVRWYVDGTINTTVDYDEITAWSPATGVNLRKGQTSSAFTVDTTSGSYAAGVTDVEAFGIYEMGWDYSE